MPKLPNKLKRKLSEASGAPEKPFDWLQARLQPVPEELLKEAAEASVESKTTDCTNYDELIESWKVSMRWRPDLEIALTAMLAVAVSTEQVGDQLFLQVIGDPGSGKSRFCDAFLTTPQCYAIESITGFVSGWSGSKGDEDNNEFSLLSRVNKKIMVTPEADVIMNSPGASTIMSQMRRMFDGNMTATYKNRKNDLNFDGLRTPWIMAGTFTLLDSDQSRLGDRFLKVFVETPGSKEKLLIQRRIVESALGSLGNAVCDKTKDLSDEAMTQSSRLTGGYVEYLRDNASQLIKNVSYDLEEVVEFASSLANFAADFRARPPKDKMEADNTKEMPTRLTSQFTRFLICAAAAMGHDHVSDQAKLVTTKVALNTAFGRNLAIAEILRKNPMDARGLAAILAIPDTLNVRKALTFMSSKKIGIVKRHARKSNGRMKVTNKWTLTIRTRKLMDLVLGEHGE